MLTEKQAKVVKSYKDKSKLKAVKTWRKRLFNAGIPMMEVSRRTGIRIERLSEWAHFKRQPTDQNFNLVEKTILDLIASQKGV